MGSPNLLAYAVLGLWPVLSLVLFQRLPLGRALIASLLVGYLFLPPPPTGLDLPLLPPFTKDTIPSLVATILCLILAPSGPRSEPLIPQGALPRVLIAAFLLTPIATVLTNQDPVVFGRVVLPALRLREILGIMVQQALLLAPFLLARRHLRSEGDLRDLLVALCAGGLVYSLPMLIEVRLAPQLNIWIYGFFQHSFDQMMRFGGFRPIVFLYHGLWVAFFGMTAVLAAAALARADKGSRRLGLALAALYLFAVLVLCKSVASLLYAVLLLPLVALAGTRLQIRVALVLAVLALGYPVAKGLYLVPQEQILALAERVDEDRAASLRFRFQNEDVLLDRAQERPFFGWGIWGRNLILDGTSGQILTISDGRWVIVLGVGGWFGFLAEFGLLTLPILALALRARAGPVSPLAGPVALILAINVADLIPNATITPLTWLFAGALLGYAEGRQTAPARAPAAAAAPAFRTVI